MTSASAAPDAVGCGPTAGAVEIRTIDDPDGDLRLIGVRGTITACNAHEILAAAHGAGQGLHIDLTDVAIPTVDGLRRLESSVDELERRGFHLHVVGVDPSHPALIAAG